MNECRKVVQGVPSLKHVVCSVGPFKKSSKSSGNKIWLCLALGTMDLRDERKPLLSEIWWPRSIKVGRMSASAIITDFHRISTTPPDFRSKCKWLCLRNSSTVVYSKLYDQVSTKLIVVAVAILKSKVHKTMNSTYHSSTNWNSSQLFRKKNLPHQNCLLPFLSNQIEIIVLVHGSAHHPRVSLHHPTHILNRSSRYHEVRTMMSGCPWNHECSLKTKKSCGNANPEFHSK